MSAKRYVLSALAFVVLGVIMLAAVRAEAPFILGALGGFLKAFVIVVSREGKQRELGLWTMVGITVFALAAGFYYGVFVGNTLPIQFALGLTLGAFSGTTLGWLPPATK